MAFMSNYLLTEASIAAAGSFTSAAIDIEKATACGLHVQSITGSGTPGVSFTYTVSSSRDGVYVPGENVIASKTAIGVSDFTPEPASFIKIIITNTDGGAATVPRVVLAIQDLG